ncbi:MAG: BMP family protein [Planctomycetaceae bacterium]
MNHIRVSRRAMIGATLALPVFAANPLARNAGHAQESVVAIMVTGGAGLGDQDFNDLMNEGGTVGAAEFGAAWRVIESAGPSDYVPNLTAAAEQGQLVVAAGFLLTEAIETVASQFPNRFFTLIDSAVDLPNVQSVVYRMQEAAFLGGVAAGLTTKTNVLGFVGGERIPPVMRSEIGFRAGVSAVNADADVLVAYVDSFDDSETGKMLALEQFNKGADILYPVAGLSENGCYEAVAELKNLGEQWVIASDVTQDHAAPGFELAVCRKGVDTAAYRAVQQVVQGNFEPGTNDLGLGTEPVGFDNPDIGVGFEDPNNRVAEDVREIVAEYQMRIVEGTLVVPQTYDELESHQSGTPATTQSG